MPRYGKRYSRSRRFSRRRRTLSSRNIYINKSARSQAYQISALNRKVNKVYRSAKPEVKIFYNPAVSFSFDSQTLLNTYESYFLNVPQLGTGDNQRIGNYVKNRNLQLNFSFEYYNSSNTGYHNTESSGSAVRVIVGQFKQAVAANPPSISGVLQESSNTGAAYTNQAICPLNTQITEFTNILADKRFILTSSSNQRIIRLNVYPKPYRFNKENNQYNGVFVMIISAGLHSDQNFSEFITGTMSYKLAYTDA